jgi:PAS domain S-box-containing protein
MIRLYKKSDNSVLNSSLDFAREFLTAYSFVAYCININSPFESQKVIVMGKMPSKDDLRRRAEEKVEMLVRKNLAHHLGDVHAKEILHELQVHMVELAMQNEELKAAHEAVDKAKNRYQALYDTAPVCYLTIDKDGMIYEANRTATSLLKVSRDKLIRQYFQSFLDRESADSLHLFLKNNLPQGKTESLVYKLQPSEGPAIEMSLRINAEYDNSNRPVQYRVVLVDLQGFMQGSK